MLKKLQKSSESDWHCYDTAWNKKSVLKMCMAWSEASNLVKNVNLQRGRLPEPDDVLDGWTNYLSLDVVKIKEKTKKKKRRRREKKRKVWRR